MAFARRRLSTPTLQQWSCSACQGSAVVCFAAVEIPPRAKDHPAVLRIELHVFELHVFGSLDDVPQPLTCRSTPRLIAVPFFLAIDERNPETPGKTGARFADHGLPTAFKFHVGLTSASKTAKFHLRTSMSKMQTRAPGARLVFLVAQEFRTRAEVSKRLSSCLCAAGV